jgi:hypothetical protein
MLVAVSVLGLLVAILSPSLSSARQQAHQLVCAARLQQWGMAFNCHAAEMGGLFLHGLTAAMISDPPSARKTCGLARS